jgi:hypothetical protein
VKFKWLGTELMKKVVSKPHRDAHLKHGQLRFAKTVRDNSTRKEGVDFPLEKYSKSKDLKQFVELCNEEGIRLIVLEMPGFKNTQNQESVGPFYPFDTENVELYNLNSVSFTSFIDENTDWIGNSHLNEKGARKFTMEMFELILNNQSFKKIDE